MADKIETSRTVYRSGLFFSRWSVGLRGGVQWYRCFFLASGNACLVVCLWVTMSQLTIFKCKWPRALDEFPPPQIRSVEGTRNIRFVPWSRVMTYNDLIERAQKLVVPTLTSRKRLSRPFPLHEAEAAMGGKGPVALASENLYTNNSSPKTTMKWRISSFRAILR